MPRQGFAEEPQSYQSPEGIAHGMSRPVKAVIGEGGRLVIPAALRKAIGVGPGDVVLLRVGSGELTVTSQEGAIRKIQKRLATLKKPGESLVDEFLAQRREEQRLSDERLDRLHAQGAATKTSGQP